MDSNTTEAPTPATPKPRRRERLVIAGALALGAAITATLTAFAFTGSGEANETACADALQEILRGDRAMAKPAACKGISDERMGELSFHGSPEAADEAAAKAAVRAEEGAAEDRCRADLEEQLAGVTASSTYNIDRTSACDGISDLDMKRMAAVIIYGATR